MEIVAAVSNFDHENYKNCEVYNVESCSVPGNDDNNLAGINGVVDKEVFSVEGYYDIFGIKHKELQKGINIIRFTDGSSRKIIM